jgi:phage terminase small subunit
MKGTILTKSTQVDSGQMNLRGAYGYLGVTPLTVQQEIFVLSRVRGMNVAASERAAGMPKDAGRRFLENRKEDMVAIMDFFRQQMFDQAGIDVATLTQMVMEAHRKSATATEELKAVEVLAKVHQLGGYASPQVLKDRSEDERVKELEIGPSSAKELERMSEEKLLNMAALDTMGGLDPEPIQRREVPHDVPHETIIEVDASKDA